MTLPVPVDFSRATVTLPGLGDVEIRALSRAEALELQGEGPLDIRLAEARIIAAATDTPLEETNAWLAKVEAGQVQPLMNAITELSGMVVSGPFQSP